MSGMSHEASPALPRAARLPINRCSLPAAILGSLTFQRHPVPLALDGVLELHERLFRHLDREADPARRARLFAAHMKATFSLDCPEAAGLPVHAGKGRAKASYLRMLRGWSFDADGQEGAVLKGWVESRFGLTPRHHGAPIRDFSGDAYRNYLEQRARGLYGTNALEAQLDLVYAFCQYEFGRRLPGASHLTLYRGVNGLAAHEALHGAEAGRQVLLLNSLVSFSAARERADEFGDTVLEVRVPVAKIFFHHRLLPGCLAGEDEYAVIGGLYEVRRAPG